MDKQIGLRRGWTYPILEMASACGKMLCLSQRKWLVTNKIIGRLQAELFITFSPFTLKALLGLSELFHSPLADVLDHLHSFPCLSYTLKKSVD